MRNPKAPGWPKRGERTEDPEVANRWKWAYLDWMRSEHRDRVLGLPKDRDVRATVEEYLRHRTNTMEGATVRGDTTALNHLLERVRVSKVSRLTTEAVQSMFNQMAAEGYAYQTLNQYRVSLSAFFVWAKLPPLTDIELANPGKGDVRTLEPFECEAVREAARVIDQRRTWKASVRLAVEIGLSMGLRVGEIFALRWQAIDPETKSVRVQWQIPATGWDPKPLKGKLARTALILPEWWPLHRPGSGFILPGGSRPVVGTGTQRDMIDAVLEEAGLKLYGVKGQGLGWHLLRHSFARYFIERGGRFEELQKSLGHASIRTTEQAYGHFHENVAVRLARERIYAVS